MVLICSKELLILAGTGMVGQFVSENYQELSDINAVSSTHVETVALLCRKNIDAERHVEVTIQTEQGWRADKPVNATYGQIKEWVAKYYNGMNVSSLYIAQIKEKHGLKERENYNKGKEGTRVPQCPAEKMEAIEAALRYFKLI